MVSTMTTRNVGRRTAITRGRGASEQDAREGERSGDQAGSGRGGQGSSRGSQGGGRGGQGSSQGSQGGGRDGQESDQGSQGSSRCNRVNGGGGGVPDFATIIAQQLQNLLPTIVEKTKEEHKFLGHVINGVGIHVDPNKLEAVKNWEAPRTPSEYVWGEEQERAFQTLKDKLCNAPVLALPDGPKDFM
ncbi:hypothetical protein Tco_1241050, partial [Tanacetum coccineum]